MLTGWYRILCHPAPRKANVYYSPRSNFAVDKKSSKNHDFNGVILHYANGGITNVALNKVKLQSLNWKSSENLITWRCWKWVAVFYFCNVPSKTQGFVCVIICLDSLADSLDNQSKSKLRITAWSMPAWIGSITILSNTFYIFRANRPSKLRYTSIDIIL